ncbi:MAG: hypothetical protein LDL25_07500, partial [Hyphomicrobiales bacterium]|nr:hypothetical protein [Hyphomicrobiales bacterium]
MSFLLVPLVVAARLPILAAEAFRLAQGRPAASGTMPEASRMVAEKFAAAQEGSAAALAELTRLNLEMTLRLLRGDSHGVARLANGAPMRFARAALRPGLRRVRGNAR